jgi:predicted Zn-dependent protease
LLISEAAVLSIVEQADYYESVASLSLAYRWQEAVEEAVQSLLTFPIEALAAGSMKP